MSAYDVILCCRNREALKTLLDNGTFQTINTKGSSPTMQYKGELIAKLSGAITDRFSLSKSEHGIIEATKIINLRCWPAAENEDDVAG